MTRWNDYVIEFAEKKKIAYGCAIVRHDLRKAYNKKYEPVPRNRGIYGTGKMRKMRRPATEEEAKVSALKREASFQRTADMKEAQKKKADDERQRKFQEDIDARAKAYEEKEKAEKEAKKKADEEAKAKKKAEAEKKAEADKKQAEQDAIRKKEQDDKNSVILENIKKVTSI